MACGEFGEGKMSSPRQIYTYLKNYFNKEKFSQKKKLESYSHNWANKRVY